MSSRIGGLLDRTLELAQDLFGGVVEGVLKKARRALVRNVSSLAVGATGIILALVFGAIGFNGWLETIIDADHRWVPPLIVALTCGAIGFAAFRFARDRGEP